jgi:hypothetical protein
VARLLRPGKAGSNTAADHIVTAQLALAQLPKKYRRGRQTLIRTGCRATADSTPANERYLRNYLAFLGLVAAICCYKRLIRHTT